MEAYTRPLFLAVILGIAYHSWTQSFSNYDVFGDTLHRLDPWFNFRATKYLSEHGWTEFVQWHDHKSWYPLGRPVGTSTYPGLQLTAVGLHRVLQWLGYPLPLQYACFITPCITSLLTKLFTYLLALELFDSQLSAVVSFAVLSSTPVHILNSMGGEYSFESVASLGLMATFYFWVRSLRTPSSWPIGVMTGIAYGYMVLTWGGFIFVLNMVALHAGVQAIVDWLRNTYNPSLVKAYGLFFVVGTGLATRVPIVRWTPFNSVEQLPALFVLMMLLGLLLAHKNRGRIATQKDEERITLQGLLIAFLCFFSYVFVFILGFQGKYVQFLRPSICGMIPGLLRVPSNFFYRHELMSRRNVPDEYIFQMFGVNFFASYFAIFILLLWLVIQPFHSRIFLLLALPVSCLCITRHIDGDSLAPLLALGTGTIVETGKRMMVYEYSTQLSRSGDDHDNCTDGSNEKSKVIEKRKHLKQKGHKGSNGDESNKVKGHWNNDDDHVLLPFFGVDLTAKINHLRERNIALPIFLASMPIFLLTAALILTGFFASGTHLAPIFSNPGVSYLTHTDDGPKMITDYIDSYHWLKRNTPPDARIFSTLRPSIHISSIGNRTSFGDQFMQDPSYHAIIGRILLSTPEEAHIWLRHLADYVLVLCGDTSVGDRSLIHYYAMIAHDYYSDICPADPDCSDYYESKATPTHEPIKTKLRKTLLYRLTETNPDESSQVPHPYFEEVHISTNHLVRIYKVQNNSTESEQWTATAGKGHSTQEALAFPNYFPTNKDLESLLSQDTNL